MGSGESNAEPPVGEERGKDIDRTPVIKAPEQVQARAGYKSVTLTWQEAAGAKGYRILWNKTGNALTEHTVIETADSPYTHSGLALGSNYYYVVVAYNDAKDAASEEVSAQPFDFSEPPATLTATRGISKISLEWPPVANATSYNIYWRTSPGVRLTDQSFRGVSSPFVHTGRTMGVTYSYLVTVVNGSTELVGPEIASTALNFRSPTLVAQTKINGTVVTWGNTEGASAYNLYWNRTGSVTKNDAMIANVRSPFEHEGLVTGSTYHYLLAAVNDEASVELLSNQASATVSEFAPPVVLLESRDVNQVTLSWSGGSPANSYNIYWNKTGAVTTSSTKIANVTSPYNHTVTGGDRYFYTVTAVDNTEQLEVASAEQSIIATRLVAPAIGVTPQLYRNRITRTTVAGTNEYNLYWANTAGVNLSSNKISGVATPYVHAALDPTRTYFYRFGVRNIATGLEILSSEASTMPTQLDRPQLTLAAGTRSITLTWPAVPQAASYDIYWNNTGSVTTTSTRIANVTSPYVHDNLTSNMTYHYIVTANYGPHKRFSAEKSETIDNALYVRASAVDDSGDGSRLRPKKSIQSAINAAPGPIAIRIAEGVYNEALTMKAGVSLYGSYKSDFSERYNPGLGHDTMIVDPRTVGGEFDSGPATILFQNINADDVETTIDRLVVQSALVESGTSAVALRALNSKKITIASSNLQGRLCDTSAAVYVDAADVAITNSDISANGKSTSYGLFYQGRSNMVVSRNRINAGTQKAVAAAGILDFSSSTVVITGNHIEGGRTSPDFRANNSYGLNIVVLSPTRLVANNTIYAGRGYRHTHGIRIAGETANSTGSVMIRNNTISGGAAELAATGITLGSDIAGMVNIDNNLIFTEPVTVIDERNCIKETYASSTPRTLRNNNFFECIGLYIDNQKHPACGSLGFCTTAAQINDMMGVGAANISVSVTFGANYRISAAPLLVAEFGINATTLGWGYLDDKDGRTRKLPISPQPPGRNSGWSMGAYEYGD